MKNSTLKRKLNVGMRYTVLTVVGLFMMYPLLWLIGACFKENSEIFTSAAFWPKNAVNGWESFVNGWKTNTPFSLGHYFINSLKYLVPRTIFTVISRDLKSVV